MTTTVVNNPDQSRYEISIDGDLVGVAVYELGENSINFTHTQVETDNREQGLGGTLVKGALDDVRSESSARVIATCPFVVKWVSEHPDYQDLLKCEP
jgi:predicted GNAT family acetyltransferase